MPPLLNGLTGAEREPSVFEGLFVAMVVPMRTCVSKKESTASFRAFLQLKTCVDPGVREIVTPWIQCPGLSGFLHPESTQIQLFGGLRGPALLLRLRRT